MSNEVRTTGDLKGFLNKHIDAIQSVAASTLTPERMVRLVCAAASRDERLAQCSPLSILRSMSQAASMGLEPFDGRNEVHLVPRWNKKAKCLEATCLVGYPGLIRLAMETGKVNFLDSQVVYEKDEYDYELGDNPHIKHKPYLGKDRGNKIFVYAIAKLATGEKKIEIIPWHEVEEIRDRSVDMDKASPWKTDEAEMGRKTGIRRISKYIPRSKPLAIAMEIQAKAEAGEYIDAETIRPGDANPPELATKVINEDGQDVWAWTEEERSHCLVSLDGYIEAMCMGGVPESEAIELADDYKAKIGAPDLSPTKWADHLQTASDYRIKKARKTA